MQVEVRLGVDAEVLAEQRGEIQDPLVDFDHFVGRERRSAVAGGGFFVALRALRGGRGVLDDGELEDRQVCLLYTSPSPRD